MRNWNTILTLRGLLILLLSAYLIAFPAYRDADIVASVLGIGLGLILLISAAITISRGLKLRRQFSLYFISTNSSENQNPYSDYSDDFVSGLQSTIGVKTSARRLFPFFHLEIQPVLEHDTEFKLASIVLRGTNKKPAHVVTKATFPHRGIWSVRTLNCSFKDQFSLTRFRWHINPSQAFRVKPPTAAESGLPVLSSSHRSGEESVDILHRQGDPFDLKPYHPSDGIKKIVWKVFAKSRQLISRHPEASFTPEGQVVIFIVADKEEDMTCAQALSYLRLLEGLDLELFVGCSTQGKEQVVHSATQTEDVLIESVWNSHPLLSTFTDFITEAKKKIGDARLARVLIFASEARIKSQNKKDALLELGSFLSKIEASPVYMICGGAGYQVTSLHAGPKTSLTRRIVSYAFEQDLPADNGSFAHKKDFISVCGRNNWEYIDRE